ncbi:unnamed protein product [Bursaphelenchus xylophilus]|uniref:(pine wood nematode) hypothetical protein n=1 Tax=Bursaphelenchus xylophilus TaxID=6326 RepID=A0A1I7RZG9_BURXY|nr:unnamed protein product [Bursaphelenchus xylophilus]CAG9106402.1 unnamed protein product [Bursaphelenchus xylophilus]
MLMTNKATSNQLLVVNMLRLVQIKSAEYMHSPSNMRGYTRFIANFTIVFLTVAGGHAILAQCNCLAYRFAVLYSKEFLAFVLSWRSWAKTFAISVVITVIAEIYIVKLQVPQSLIPDRIKKTAVSFPLAEIPVTKDQVFMYCDVSGDLSMVTLSFVLFGFFTAEFVSIGFVTFILKELQSKKDKFSKRTYQLHRQLTIALGAQLLTPILFILLPFLAILFILYINAYSSKLPGRIIIICFELYGFANSAITIYFIKPYRSIVIYKIRGFLRLKRHDIIEKRLSVTPVHPIESLLM